MINRHCMILLSVLLLCGSAGIAPVLADEKQEVNTFYQTFLSTMKNQGPQAARLANLVEKNRKVAERCLALLKEKSGETGPKADAHRFVAAELENILLVTRDRLDCSDSLVQRLTKAAQQQVEDVDREFLLSRVARMCPGDGSIYIELGHLYLRNRQFGMAMAAYQDALKRGSSSEAQEYLRMADDLLAHSRKSEPITEQRVTRLFAEPEKTMLPVPAHVGTKVSVTNAIDMRDVLFDEWSSQIKDQFKSSLNVIGRTAQKQFQDHPQLGLMVEGHTDKRGPLDKNEQLSWNRAEAIKGYLVATFGLEPSRVRTRGYGPHRPVAATDDEAGWALNRRVEFKKIEDIGAGQ